MKFLVDENIGTSVVSYLRERGYEVYWIRERNPGMSDLAILRLTLKQKRVLITYDQDFGELVFHQKAEHYGVLLLRLGIDTPSIHTRALENFLALYEPEEIEGEFWKVDERYL